ncbi:hypothetical protein WMF31_13755 [Sorangium sp. So ce1036]|uniref:hypothetical protein n=1 Tax=Sorangium sp. So ce1036 TaxID=3133328 RepID=UPI003F0DDA34
MRRHVLLAACACPILAATAAATVPGCGEEFEDICAFLEDPNSCYATYHRDIGARCGAQGDGDAPKGTFASREALDVCFLNEGGQVVFDPPLDLAAFPPKSLSFKRLDALAQECGSFTFSGEYSYSVTIHPCGETEEDTAADAGPLPLCADGSGAGEGIARVSGGTVTVTTPEGRDTLDVSCADGTTHHFNRIDAERKCVERTPLLPRAVLEASAGNQPPPDAGPVPPDTFAGSISFRVHYPPSAGSGAAGDVVTYFTCQIPPPAAICFNGEKDGLETDIDCGGTLCEKRCGKGQSCAQDSDCDGLSCLPDTSGFRKCTDPNAEP